MSEEKEPATVNLGCFTFFMLWCLVAMPLAGIASALREIAEKLP